jgi:hypothetical protein
MKFAEHYGLRGKHAILSASKYHWLRYTEDKFLAVYHRRMAQKRGTELHAFAEKCIELGQKLPRSRKALNRFVNDAIGYNMTPEVILLYSQNAFGTADAVSFRNNLLRIHDLKTGTTKASMDQLLIYAAFFCLEYDKKPDSITIELRIYQGSEIYVHEPDPEELASIMLKVVLFDKKIQEMEDFG